MTFKKENKHFYKEQSVDKKRKPPNSEINSTPKWFKEKKYS